MRLLVTTILALAVPALAQPAAALAHYRHQLARHASYHYFAKIRPYRAARVRAEFAQRDGSWNAPSYARPFAARSFEPDRAGHGNLDAMIARHAASEGVPEALVRRVVTRESRYQPRAVGAGGAMGLMQIKYSTARAMGYTGSAAGLLDPDTNLTYAVRYLAGAYRAANGNPDRAVMNYARGYYASAKRTGFSPYQAKAWNDEGDHAWARPMARHAWGRAQYERTASEAFYYQLHRR